MDFDVKIDLDEKGEYVNEQEGSSIIVDVSVYVGWLDYIEIKYGISSLPGLMEQDELGLITSQFTGARDIEARLKQTHQITSTITQEVIAKVKSSKTYVDYTNESGTIVLTIEKVFQVCSRIFSKFQVGKKGGLTVISYEYEGVAVTNGSIPQLIETLKEIYSLKNKKLMLEGNCKTYYDVMYSVMVKKYVGSRMPDHINKFWIQFTQEIEMVLVPPSLLENRSVQILVSAIVDNNVMKVEIDETQNNNITRVEVNLNTCVTHELDRQISKQYTVEPEIQSLVDSFVGIKIVAEDEVEELVDYFKQTHVETDSKIKTISNDRKVAVLNQGWLTAPKKPATPAETRQQEYALDLQKQLKDYEHFFFFCPITYDFIRVRHKSGIKVVNVDALNKLLRALTKFFHFMNHVNAYYRKDKEKLEQLFHSMIASLASTFCSNLDIRPRFATLFKANYAVWSRKIIMTEFGLIRDTYLPDTTMGGNETYDENEEVLNLSIDF
jgi:hypothetical protein